MYDGIPGYTYKWSGFSKYVSEEVNILREAKYSFSASREICLLNHHRQVVCRKCSSILQTPSEIAF